MAKSVDLDQTAPIGAVCSGPMLFPSIPNWSVKLGNYLQQTIFSDALFLGAFRVKVESLGLTTYPKKCVMVDQHICCLLADSCMLSFECCACAFMEKYQPGIFLQTKH